jgi:2,5-furandicarboxylate decarboxylase 1
VHFWEHEQATGGKGGLFVRAESFRTWLEYLHQTDRLATVRKPVSLRFELAAIAKHLDGRKAVKFERVDDHPMSVVAGMAANRKWLAEACDVEVAELVEKFYQATIHPMQCSYVDKREAPVKEKVILEDIDLLKALPIPIHHEMDAGHYITAGLFIVRDPQTRKQNVSIHRLQVTGKSKLGILMLPRHTYHLYKQAEERNQPLECAIVIGIDPITMLASQASTPFGIDELEIASALRGTPLPLVRCETVDIDVPAESEIVIEGRILPHIREPEGPFGEFPKYYGPRSDKEVIEVTAITHRRDAVYYTIVPAGYEHLLLGGIPREASLLQTLRQTIPTVKAVHMTLGGACRYHAVISIRKTEEGQGKNAILSAFANSFDIKHVVVVDEDVDIYDPEEVEWALATRFQADRDLVVVAGTQGSKLDPSTDAGLSSKMGFDCTIPLDSDPFHYLRIQIPGYSDIKLEDYGLEAD